MGLSQFSVRSLLTEEVAGPQEQGSWNGKLCCKKVFLAISKGSLWLLSSLGVSEWLFATSWTAKKSRLPCPSPSPGVADEAWLPGVCSNSSPLSWWCHLTTSVAPFSSCPQSFPASGSFPVSWCLISKGIYGYFPGERWILRYFKDYWIQVLSCYWHLETWIKKWSSS